MAQCPEIPRTRVAGRRCRARWLGAGLALVVAAPFVAADSVKRITPDLVALGKLAAITLPPPPAWSASPAGGSWSLDDVAAEFKKVTNRPPAINCTRTSFVRPNHQWLKAFNDWFVRLQKSLKLSYKDEVWDCDNYAQSFVAFADLVALGGGEARGSICIGWATVFNRRAFGGIAASSLGGHAVVVVGSMDGLFVIEPQTGKMAALREYPNRDEFADVNL